MDCDWEEGQEDAGKALTVSDVSQGVGRLEETIRKFGGVS